MSREWVDQTPCAVELSRIEELCDRGLFLQAHDLARPLGPFERWEGAQARLLAARLAGHLGASKRAFRLMASAYRHYRKTPFGVVARADLVLIHRGPFEAWESTAHL